MCTGHRTPQRRQVAATTKHRADIAGETSDVRPFADMSRDEQLAVINVEKFESVYRD
jgi:hypothetical protein